MANYSSKNCHEISNAVYVWTVVLVLPVNSAINQLFFTIPDLMAKWEKFKYGDGKLGYVAASFPLDNCDTGQFDILVMNFDSKNDVQFVENLKDTLKYIWPNINNPNQTRVRMNTFSTIRPNKFYSCNSTLVTYEGDFIDLCRKIDFMSSLQFSGQTILEEVQLNMKIATSIFLDMGFGRKDSTLVVINAFIGWLFPTLTNGDSAKLQEMLEKGTLGINFFFIMINFWAKDNIFTRNVISSSNVVSYAPTALCNKCPDGWFHETEKSSSCYYLFQNLYSHDWNTALAECIKLNGFLVTIESEEELNFLKEQLVLQLLTQRLSQSNLHWSPEGHAVMYINLKRDSENFVKKFQWAHPGGSRPLVINHWLPGEPAGGASQSCGMWVFNAIFNYTVPDYLDLDSPISSKAILLDYKKLKNSEGWASTGCGLMFDIQFSLCEVPLFININDNDDFRIYSANKISFNQITRNSEYMEFEEKLVSASTYVSSEAYRTFLIERNEEFPVFDCGEDENGPRYISYSYVCDCIDHCSNRRDEMTCSGLVYISKCRSGQCFFNENKCDMVKDCDDGSDEENCLVCDGLRCCDGTCLPAQFINDNEIDCTECKTVNNVTLNDESEVFSGMFIDMYRFCEDCDENYCTKPNCLIPPVMHNQVNRLEAASSCTTQSGRSIWAPRCVYIKDRYGAIVGCRDVSHLQNCNHFVCQEGYYKCPDSYCIPIHYVLDGKSDCPSGEEEKPMENHTCTGNFACWNSQVCLHPDLVCDRYTDCPYKDDELNCLGFCKAGFRCIAGTVMPLNKKSIEITSLEGAVVDKVYIDLSGLDLSNVSNDDYCSPRVYDIQFSGCRLTDNQFPLSENCLTNVYKIDLSFNNFTRVQGDVSPYRGFYNLREMNLSFNFNLKQFIDLKLTWLTLLDLSHTGLTAMEKNIFYDLPNLKHLNLSHTQLSQFRVYISPPGFTLQTLDLRGSPIVKFFKQTFNSLTIASSLYSDNFAMCCPQIRGRSILGDLCFASENPISSCFDLISVNIQRILLWVTAGIAVLGNLVVILYRLIWDRNVLSKAYGLFVLHLAISDLIMGLYLLMIAVADLYYRGKYVLYDQEWRESVVCKIAGFFATLSSETSTFFIFLITVDRFLVLRFPFGQINFSGWPKISSLIFAWFTGFLLALLPVLPIFGNQSIFSSNAMCIGLPLRNKRIDGWGYSFCVFIVLNFFMFFVIAFGQVAIFRSISANRMSMEATSQNSVRRAQDITVAKQLSLVILSNFLCWFPIGVMGFLSLSGHEISNDVYTWTVVLVLPVNSAINPLLYTIPVLMAKWENFKYGDSSVNPRLSSSK